MRQITLDIRLSSHRRPNRAGRWRGRWWRRPAPTGPPRVARLRASATAAACLGLVLAAAGCSPAEPVGKAAVQPQIALELPDFTSDNWDDLRNAAATEGQNQSISVMADAAEADDNGAVQARRVTALTAEKYNCFIIAPVNTVELVSPLAALTKKHIPIINIGMELDQNAVKSAGVTIASYIGPQDSEVGHLAARRMLTAVPAHSQVALIVGKQNDPNSAEQRSGFEEAVDGKLSLYDSNATNNDYEKAIQVVTDLLAAKPGLRGIFASSDTVGLAAVKAVKAAGMSDKVSVISVDGSQQGLRAVKAGTLTGTVATYPAVTGSVVVRACQRLIAGTAVQPRLTTPAQLIDTGNVDQALKFYPQPFQQFQDPLT